MIRSLAAALLLAPALLAAQQPTGRQLASTGAPPPITGEATRTAAMAIRASAAPVLDGKEDDPIWRSAQIIDQFRQFQPVEDGEPTFRTVAKVAYDDRNLYVLVRMYDPHPDSIVALLSRRDVRTQSEWIKIMIDSYHDRRTCYEMAVNPRGVKRDYYSYNDNTEDESWDGVWDVATSIDSLGWVAEFRVPFSQLRFPRGADHTFGLAIWRDIARLNERDSWPVYRRSRPGISSQLGEVSGIRDIGSPRRLEVMPYVVAKNVPQPTDGLFHRDQQTTAGADIKYGVTSNLTLDATINPDFGQVEADPAVLNLSAFETFFQEKRPFFIEGTGIFRFDVNCNNGTCTGLFYSRRIGREPHLFDDSASTPSATTILSAAKLTGRLQSGLSVGVLDAVTQRESGFLGQTVEPGTNYFVGRAQQDLREGATSIGAMVTAVNRRLDDDSSRVYLRRTAYSGGVDARHQFHNRNYELSGYVTASRVEGSADAIAQTQLSSTHFYQRPDAGVSYDPTRTVLGGDAEQVGLGKIGGGMTRFNTNYQRISPGFEINDVGFLQSAGTQSWSNWFGLQFDKPKHFYRQAFLNFNEWNGWNTLGLGARNLTNMGANINGSVELKNSWSVNGGIELDDFVPSYDNRLSRGGPAVRRSPATDIWWGVQADPRMRIQPSVAGWFWWGGSGHSRQWGIDPQLLMNVSSSLMLTLSPHYDLNVNDAQWLGNFSDPGGDTSYTFGHLDQTTVWLTARADYTVTPRLSVQFYAQPFLSSGTYTDWRELGQPRARDYDARWKPFTPSDGSTVDANNFRDSELRTNLIVRWEYRRGSTLYAVWTQGRSDYLSGPQYGTFSLHQDTDYLFGVHPRNTFLLKASYWFSP